MWRDAKNRPLYIGKAVNLRSRLLSYKKQSDTRASIMVGLAKTLNWHTTPTDIEALILESQLIKKFKPRFNIEWRDDKNYFLVAVTDEEFPQFILTHQIRSHKIKKPVCKYIGPFTEGEPLKATLRVLRGLFPYCTCKQTHHLKCLNAHIGKCPGYCCLKTPATSEQKKEYARNIRAIRDLLTGKRNTVIRRFAKTDADVAMKLFRVFQNAQINTRLRQGFGGQVCKNAPRRIEGYDVANIGGQHSVGAMVVFTNGKPDKNEYRLFNLKETAGDVPMLREMLKRRMRHAPPTGGWPLPNLVIIDGGKAQLNVAKKIFGTRMPIAAVTKDERHRASKLIGVQADQTLAFAVDAEAHRFAISHYRRRHRKALRGAR